jgi:serine O-acetyltransferase
MFKTLREDIRTVLERDPAANNRLHVFLLTPGLHAIWAYRIAHGLWIRELKLLALFVSYLGRSITGVEIHPGAEIGPRFFIDHGMGVVIGETAEIAPDVTLYHGVTLGGVSSERGKRHPTLGSGVVVGAGAKILGAITIGANTRIGANAVVVKDIEPNKVVVGIPGKPVEKDSDPNALHKTDLQHGDLPDVVAERMNYVLSRLDSVEYSVRLMQHSNGFMKTEQESEPEYFI